MGTRETFTMAWAYLVTWTRRVFTEDSCFGVLSVITDIIRVLVLLSDFLTISVIIHASDPHVRMLHTAYEY